jgi:hypothetical protein
MAPPPSNLVNPWQFSVNGQRPSSNYFTVDAEKCALIPLTTGQRQ